MPEHATWLPASPGERPLPETVRAFLLESERRVLSHCPKLLAQDNLPGHDRQRLLRLAATAEEEMHRLAGRNEIKAA
jgi:hypothetical protein